MGKEKQRDFHQIPSDERIIIAGFEPQTAGFLDRNGFFLHWLGLGCLITRLVQKMQSISCFCEKHQDSETTRWDQKSLSFPVTEPTLSEMLIFEL